MKNILTFDIEDWFHANYCDVCSPEACNKSNFRENMHKILEMCSKYKCKATFFVLGCIGENYPDIVKLIDSEGHDVASHGYSHELAYKQSKEEFAGDVKKAIAILEDVIGHKVLGYRAPSWSIVKDNFHYLEVLEQLGLMYDASVFPVKNFLYGIPDINRRIHKPVVEGRELKLFEVPTSVFDFMGKGMGYSGGFYFRFFPYFMIKRFVNESNKIGKPSIVYLHPREIDPTEQRLSLPLMERFIHYYNITGTYKKLENIMKEFEFTSIKDHLVKEYQLNLDEKQQKKVNQ